MLKGAVLVVALMFAGAGCASAPRAPAEAAERAAGEAADASPATANLFRKLRSSDAKEVHEALLLVRQGQFQDRQPRPVVLSEVISALDRLLDDPKHGEAGTRRLACEVLGRSKSEEAIPVLLRALRDPFEQTEFLPPPPGVGGAHVEWYAVWRDADDALRQITGADPIREPRQRFPVQGQREAVRKAWLRWWAAHSGQSEQR